MCEPQKFPDGCDLKNLRDAIDACIDESAAAPNAGEHLRTAVVVVHGMGEQYPMDTTRAFVDAVWTFDCTLFRKGEYRGDEIWSKPDLEPESSELRRLKTTNARHPGVPYCSRELPPKANDSVAKKGPKIDFFELHWADITAGATFDDVLHWAKELLFRLPFYGVPKRLRAIWAFAWLLTLVGTASAVYSAYVPISEFFSADERTTASEVAGVVVEKDAFPAVGHTRKADGPTGRRADDETARSFSVLQLLALASLVGSLFIARWFKSLLGRYLGDVARYVTPEPANIAIRREARKRGVTLIRKLHQKKKYQRIIVVGHSLGSVLAHDIIAMYWAEVSAKWDFKKEGQVLRAIEESELASSKLIDMVGWSATWFDPTKRRAPRRECHGLLPQVHLHRERVGDAKKPCVDDYLSSLRSFRLKQRDLYRQLAKLQQPWLVSDFVTIGSPLTYADFLLSKNECEFSDMQQAGEVMRCPPVMLEVTENSGQFTFWTEHFDTEVLDHGAAMAATRWTNIYDESPVVGCWKGDFVSGPLRHRFGPGVADYDAKIPGAFTHTRYWDRYDALSIRRAHSAGIVRRLVQKAKALNFSPKEFGRQVAYKKCAPSSHECSAPKEYEHIDVGVDEQSIDFRGHEVPHIIALRRALNLLDDPSAEEALLAEIERQIRERAI